MIYIYLKSTYHFAEFPDIYHMHIAIIFANPNMITAIT